MQKFDFKKPFIVCAYLEDEWTGEKRTSPSSEIIVYVPKKLGITLESKYGDQHCQLMIEEQEVPQVPEGRFYTMPSLS